MKLDELFDKIKLGKISKKDAQKELSLSWIETTNKNILDINRFKRTGFPEIIYAEYKSFKQVVEIAETILATESLVMISRFPKNGKLKKYFSEKYPVHKTKRLLVVGKMPKTAGNVLVISGGSADHPIIAEIDLALRALGVNPLLFEDRGIAHPTRVLEAIKTGVENNVKVVIVVAGMEASLATFVSSLLPLPIIGVPTSIGYGYKAKESALISMLSACTSNLAVVNIDSGIRAAVIASLISKNSR